MNTIAGLIRGDMKVKDAILMTEYKTDVADQVIKSLYIKSISAFITLLFYVYSDLIIRENLNAFYTRLLPIIVVVILLVLHTLTKSYRAVKVKLYQLFLASAVIMMLGKCLVHLDDALLASVVAGTILVVFLVSLDLKASTGITIIIYFLPLTVFLLLLVFVYDVTKEQVLVLEDVFPVFILGFIVNMVQGKMRYKLFEATYSLGKEKMKTIQLYEETLAQNEEISVQKDEIEFQKMVLEESNKDMCDSINYASRIQSAMLPHEAVFRTHFSDYFILYKPRDIVSGDFYWAKTIENKLVFAAADSTGHGVPGAFVSMLGMSLLNDIVTRAKELNSSEILNDLRDAIKLSLRQSFDNNSNKDGMDIALCIIDLETNRLEYSGAYNPLFIIRNKELIQIAADRQPIAIYIREKEFVRNEFQLMKGDLLYLFSDGYCDQFNENDIKFTIKQFRKVLLDNSMKSLGEQKEELESLFLKWKGSREQIDDIVILGLKI